MTLLRPSFFIAGAPKAGTSALHSFLSAHPQVCMSRVKEPNYFSHDAIAKQKLYYESEDVTSLNEYLQLFNCSDTAVIAGEGSVSYLFYPEVAQRIFDFNPDSKIIISLRQPVSRAFSHYQMDYSLGLVNADFDVILENGAGHPLTGIYYQQYVQLGDYSSQIKRYLDVFPAKQVFILLYEELAGDPELILRELSSFLGISNDAGTGNLEKVNVTAAAKNSVIRKLYSSPAMRKFSNTLLSSGMKSKLREKLFSKESLPVLSSYAAGKLRMHYKKDLPALQELTSRDFSLWQIN
jgi:hypothetical protein